MNDVLTFVTYLYNVDPDHFGFILIYVIVRDIDLVLLAVAAFHIDIIARFIVSIFTVVIGAASGSVSFLFYGQAMFIPETAHCIQTFHKALITFLIFGEKLIKTFSVIPVDILNYLL